jgi:hypothetical protein
MDNHHGMVTISVVDMPVARGIAGILAAPEEVRGMDFSGDLRETVSGAGDLKGLGGLSIRQAPDRRHIIGDPVPTASSAVQIAEIVNSHRGMADSDPTDVMMVFVPIDQVAAFGKIARPATFAQAGRAVDLNPIDVMGSFVSGMVAGFNSNGGNSCRRRKRTTPYLFMRPMRLLLPLPNVCISRGRLTKPLPSPGNF